MTAKDLKAALLQEAVQGKLVPQIASEGNARDLLEEIKKIRNEELGNRSKTLDARRKTLEAKVAVVAKRNAVVEPVETTIPDEAKPCLSADKPFDIPQSWEWCRLGEIVYNNGQKTPDKEFSYIDIGSIDNEHQKLNEKETFISPENAPSRARKIVKKGDIIYSTVRPYLHNMCIIDKDFQKEPIASTGFAVMSCYPQIDNKYLFYYLLSPSFDNYANDTENSKGVAYPAINDKKLYNGIIPLPPLAEQKRIVAALEKMLPLVEEYGKKEEELSALNEKISSLAKKAVLQEAVQGKLVPQIESEGNARDLLEQIREQLLVDSGQRNKTLDARRKTLGAKATKQSHQQSTPIPDEEKPCLSADKPFDIPQSWEWCRLGEICELTSGQDLQPDSYNDQKKGIPYITGASNFENNQIKINRWTETPKSIALRNDLLLTCKGTVGEMAFLKEDKVHIARQVMSLRFDSNISSKYARYYLFTQIENLKSKAKSMIPGIARNDVNMLEFPLPPLAEQKRIVAALEKILPLCERLGK